MSAFTELHLLEKPEELREVLKSRDEEIKNTTYNFSDLSIGNEALKLKSGEEFPLLPEMRKKIDRLIGLSVTQAKLITDDHRNHYLEKYKSRKLKLFTHEPSGEMVTLCGIDENPYTNNRILTWLSLFASTNPELKLDLIEFNNRRLEVEIVNDKYHFEAAPMDLLKTSLLVKSDALTGRLNILASLYRQVCANGSTISEMSRQTHVGLGSDAGAYRMNLNRELASQLKSFTSINEGIKKLITDVPEDIMVHADEWLLRQRQPKNVRLAIANDLEVSNAQTKYDVFNSITHARHELRADASQVSKLGVLAGKYYTDQTFEREMAI